MMRKIIYKTIFTVFCSFIVMGLNLLSANHALAETAKVNGRITQIEINGDVVKKAEAQYIVSEKGLVRTSDITEVLNNLNSRNGIVPKVGEKIVYTVDKSTLDTKTGTIKALSVLEVGGWNEDSVHGEGSTSTPGGYYSELFQRYVSKESALKDWVGLVFNWALGIIGTIAVLVIIVAGIMYTTSGGNPDQTGKAKSLITHALIGVAILILARLFLNVLGAPH